MAESAFQRQNQLQFNLGVPLAASNIAVRYHKPNPIVVERAGGVTNVPQQSESVPSARTGMIEDKMALAVRLAQRDLKRQKETGESLPARSRSPSPRPHRSKVTKGGTRMVYTKEAQVRAARLQNKRVNKSYMKAREQGWNSGTTATTRTQTPPRDKQARFNLPATTNSPPTRDTDRYPISRSAPQDDPCQEIERLQREMEGYLQQIQVIEQRAMKEDSPDLTAAPKSRRRDGYLSDEEDPTRRALRHEEQATRASRQMYNLRQQVRMLQEHVTRAQGRKIKHTKKSQVMLRLAAAHRGAVRAIQSFVNQQLPDQDLKQGLPAGYGELALLIRQLALLSTQIRTERDTAPVHEDLLKMLDRVDDLNKAWCEEMVARKQHEAEAENQQRRRKSPLGRQPDQGPVTRGRQPWAQPRGMGKENRPKGLLKKQYKRPNSGVQKSQPARKVTPERQRVLQAGIEALMRGNQGGRHGTSGMAWDISGADDSAITMEPQDRSLILPKGLQYKRERAQRNVAMAVPETHFSDPTLASSLKNVNPDDREESQREPWKPGGSLAQSPHRRSKSKERSRSRGNARDRSRSQGRSQNRSRSHSPRIPRSCVIQDMDEELIQELFPQGVDGQGGMPRSRSPSPRTPRSRSPSTRPSRQRSRSPQRSRQPTGYAIHKQLTRLDRGAEDQRMIRERQQELSELNHRGLINADVAGESVADLLLTDLMAEAADELTSMEQDAQVRKHARKMQNNPTLENMYQRLEQMELEQSDIRRRWGSFQFEEETRSRGPRHIERPSGPVAMEIKRKDHSQSHRVQSSRAFDKEKNEPIIFTKSAPAARYDHKKTPLEDEGDSYNDLYDDFQPRFRLKTKLKVPDSVVKEVHSNLAKFQQHLRRTSHYQQGRFDPWKLVEEIADQVMDECLREVDKELDEIGENIVHQVCKAEFAVPENQPANQSADFVVDYESDGQDRDIYTGRSRSSHSGARRVADEPISTQMYSEPIHKQKEVGLAPRRKEPDIELDQNVYSSVDMSEQTSYNRSIDQSHHTSVNKSVDPVSYNKSVEKTAPTASKKEVSFNQEISYEREAIFDAADLDTAIEGSDYEEEGDFEDDDDDDDVEEVSPIDSDDLEYSTDET